MNTKPFTSIDIRIAKQQSNLDWAEDSWASTEEEEDLPDEVLEHIAKEIHIILLSEFSDLWKFAKSCVASNLTFKQTVQLIEGHPDYKIKNKRRDELWKEYRRKFGSKVNVF